MTPEMHKQYQAAFGLAVFTIVYNIIEGLLATWLGAVDDSLSLFGFGVDSFIEALSGFGIAHMVLRIRKQNDLQSDRFEQTALHITGIAFYLLAAGLVITGVYNLYTGQKPDSTFWGVVISCISIIVMIVLLYQKRKVGNALHSPAILADAECTRVCIYMSLVLLAASAVYHFTGFAQADSIGTLGLAWFSYREGKECFENNECKC